MDEGRLDSRWREAPDGQPTENIELQLRSAQGDLSYWERNLKEDRRNVERSERAVESRKETVTRLAWQLEQRKKREEGK